MKRTAILASVFAFALSFVASAADWFNGGIDSGWTNSSAMVGGLWSASDASDVMGLAEWDSTLETLVVDTDENQQMVFTATEGKDLSTSADSVTISSTIKFNAFKEDAIPDAPMEAKAGLIVVKDGEGNYDYYGLVANGDENVWEKLLYSGTVQIESAVQVDVLLKQVESRTYVNYIVDGEMLAFDAAGTDIPVVADGMVCIAAYSGSGEVSALSATAAMKMVMLTVDVDSLAASNLVAKAIYDKATGQQITPGDFGTPVQYGTVIRVEYAGVQGWSLPGGTVSREYTLTSDFKIDENVGDLPVPTAAPFTLIIADEAETSYGTIEDAVNALVESGAEEATIRLGDHVQAAGAYFWAGKVAQGVDLVTVTLDLNGFTYTLDKGAEYVSGGTVTYKAYAFGVERKYNLTVKNGTIDVAVDAPVAEFFRCFTEDGVNFEDVVLDGSNLTAQGDSYPVQGIYSIASEVYLTGTTTVTVPSGEFALVLGKHTSNYEDAVNSITVGDGVTINGNVFLGGGTYTEEGAVEGVEYFYGTMAQSAFSAFDSEMFAAGVGVSVKDLAKGTREIAGTLYKEQEDALAAFTDAETGAVLGLLAEFTVDSELGFEVPEGKAVEVDGVAKMIVPEGATLTVNGALTLAAQYESEMVETRALQIADGAFVELASTAVLTTADDWGMDMAQLGTMTINAGATINLGATPWVGESGKFNVTAGTLVQTPNDATSPDLGNCYTLSEASAATMVGEFPECLDTYVLMLGSSFTATDADKDIALEKLQSGEAGYVVTENAGVYTLTQEGGDDPVPVPVDDNPEACSNALVTAGFAADSKIVNKLTSKAKIVEFNGFLTAHGVTSVATDMTEGQKQFVYESFVLDQVLAGGLLFETEPVLKATAVTIEGTGLTLAVNLSAADVSAADIKLIAEVLADCLRAGASLETMDAWEKPTVSASTGDGTDTIVFTIEKDGAMGFYKTVVPDRTGAAE